MSHHDETGLCDVTVHPASETPIPCGLELPCPRHPRQGDIVAGLDQHGTVHVGVYRHEIGRIRQPHAAEYLPGVWHEMVTTRRSVGVGVRDWRTALVWVHDLRPATWDEIDGHERRAAAHESERRFWATPATRPSGIEIFGEG